MAKVVLVGYGKMLYSLIEGVLNSHHTLLGVFRNDRVRYNGFELYLRDIFNPSIEKTIIKSQKIYDIKGKSVNDEKFYKEIKKLNPDLIIVGSWGEKFKNRILEHLPCVNFHPALLPKNRGANPYFWTIFNNQKVTGLTIHFMNEKFDRGDIILQEAITIDELETGFTLKEKTTKLARLMVREFLDLYEKGQIQPVRQDEKYASYEPQITIKEMVVRLDRKKADVNRHLRALYPWASPYVQVNRKYIEVKKYEFLDVDEKNKNKKPHEIIEKNKEFYLLKGLDFLIKIYY